MTPRLVLCLGVASAIALLSAEARAEEAWGSPVSLPRRARLLLPACAPQPFDAEELLGSLRLELLGCGVELITTPAEVADQAEALVTIDSPGCEPRRLVLRIEHPLTRRSTTREVDLTDRPPQDRGRVLALSISELLRTRWASLSVDDAAEPAPAAEVVEPPADGADEAPGIDEAALRRQVLEETIAELERRQQAARQPDQRVLLGASLELASYPVHDSGLFGGRLAIDVRLSKSLPLHLGVDAGYRGGGGSDTLGMVKTQTATGGLSLRVQGGSERLRGGLGPRLELGWSRIEGEPTAPGYGPGRAEGFLLALTAEGVLQLRLSRRLWMVLGLSLGYVLVGLDALSTEHHVGGVAGPSLASSLGLALGL